MKRISRAKKSYKQYQITDDSGDRRYFTIIPNYILNHSTATAQALYLQLKRLAGEHGMAHPSREYLMSRLHIHHRTLKKEIAYLVQKGWIQDAGIVQIETNGGIQRVQSYKIVDLWELNNAHFKGVSNGTTPKAKGVSNGTVKGCQTGPYKKNRGEEEQRVHISFLDLYGIGMLDFMKLPKEEQQRILHAKNK